MTALMIGRAQSLQTDWWGLLAFYPLLGTSTLISSRSTNDKGVELHISLICGVWMDDAYPSFDHQDNNNPPLDYHSDNIQWLDLFGSSIWWTSRPHVCNHIEGPTLGHATWEVLKEFKINQEGPKRNKRRNLDPHNLKRPLGIRVQVPLHTKSHPTALFFIFFLFIIWRKCY